MLWDGKISSKSEAENHASPQKSWIPPEVFYWRRTWSMCCWWLHWKLSTAAISGRTEETSIGLPIQNRKVLGSDLREIVKNPCLRWRYAAYAPSWEGTEVGSCQREASKRAGHEVEKLITHAKAVDSCLGQSLLPHVAWAVLQPSETNKEAALPTKEVSSFWFGENTCSQLLALDKDGVVRKLWFCQSQSLTMFTWETCTASSLFSSLKLKGGLWVLCHWDCMFLDSNNTVWH